MSAPIMIVDEDDRPIGQATKQEAWEKGLIHRVVRLVIVNQAGEMLLQHRTPTKDIFPNCWDTAAAGHVDAGEDYDQAMQREIAEEVGLHDLVFLPLGSYRGDEIIDGRHFNRFTRVYTATTEKTPNHYEKDKIDGWQWLALEDVKRMVRDRPDEVADGLLQVITRYY